MIASNEKSKKSVRQLASEILFKVDTRKAYADILLDQALRTTGLDERDRALLTELTYGTLRWRGAIDARLCRNLSRPLTEVDAPIRNLLRLTCYQLIYLDRIPPYAAVNEAVELARAFGSRKAAGFVNGVLRNFLREPRRADQTSAEDSIPALAITHSHPEWLVRRWLDEFGPDLAPALMRANNEKPPLILRANALKISQNRLIDRLQSASIEATAASFAPRGILLPAGGVIESLPGFAEGLFQVQGEASQLVLSLLSPQPGERILDLCAAPGGKSTYIAELMHDEGETIAVDISARGIEKIKQNVGRLGLRSVRAVRADVSEPSAELDGAPYDRILVDAPCSGLGTLRAHPEIKWNRDERDIRRLSRLQLKILNQVGRHLKRDGILVYSTCTLARDENDRNVESFLAGHAEFELQDAARYLPHKAQHMARGKYFQALPHRDNIDGFFAARLRKVG
ncbi:MAG: 16S rRNA (cytosine(967)-C(5))-methyltransferase RsmB [Candidatus Binatia bacterium]